ncbi:VCBS repeat-containing protein [bacterium]|nr:VCBS repeat-containing protein [bacterium]
MRTRRKQFTRTIRYLILLPVIVMVRAESIPDRAFFTDSGTGRPPEIRSVKQVRDGVEFEVTFGGAVLYKRGPDGAMGLQIPGCGNTDETGNPMMPVLVKMIALPRSARPEDIRIEISDGAFAETGPVRIAPVPSRIRKRSVHGEVYFEERFEKNPGTYERDAFYPGQRVRIAKTGFIRDQHVLWLCIHPVQVNPVTQKLRACRSMKIRVSYGKAQPVALQGMGPWNGMQETAFVNGGGTFYSVNQPQNSAGVTYPENLTEPDNAADYLIIAADGLVQNAWLDSLARYRAHSDGYAVAVVSLGRIYDQFPETYPWQSIHGFLKYAYAHWRAPYFSDDHLGYVLLAGEGDLASANCCPSFYTDEYYYASPDSVTGNDRLSKGTEESGNYSDLRYARLNDDNGDGRITMADDACDVIVGRIPAENDQELESVVQKTLAYESGLSAEEGWRRKISLISGFTQFWTPKDLFIDIQENMSAQDYFQVAEILMRSEMQPYKVRQSFREALDEGRLILNIQAHGSESVWGDSEGWLLFRSSEVAGLHNENRLPVILSFACTTARFADPDADCLGEVFVNTDDKGAVAFFGATDKTYGDYNVDLNYYFFNSLLQHPSAGLSVHLFFACNQVPENVLYNILGDPALRIRNDSPAMPADLSVDSTEVYMSSQADTCVTVVARVRYYGFSGISDILVRFFQEVPGNELQVIGRDIIVPHFKRLAGDTLIIQSIPLRLVPGMRISVHVDPLNRITENNENNNVVRMVPDDFLFQSTTPLNGIGYSYGDTGFIDYNKDGYPDIYINNSIKDMLYKNNGDETFSPVFQYDHKYNRYTTGLLDIDNDGDLDICNGMKVYQNMGSDQFLSRYFNAADTNRFVYFRGAGDFNQDGYPDLMGLGVPSMMFKLFLSDGNGGFDMYPFIEMPDSTRSPNLVLFGDMDNDGHLEVMINIMAKYWLLKITEEGLFQDITSTSGLSHLQGYAQLVDYDNDRDTDVLVYDDDFLVYYQNDGTGRFQPAGEIHVNRTSPFICADFDNDGFADILSYDGFRSEWYFYRNDQQGHFYEIFPMGHRNLRYKEDIKCVALGDYNNDGFIDLFCPVASGTDRANRESIQSPILFKNRGNRNHWLKISLSGKTSNSFGIGTRIFVRCGDLLQMRDVVYEWNAIFHCDFDMEFGLGYHTSADSVVVRWPSGIVDVLTHVPANQMLTIEEGRYVPEIPQVFELGHNYPNPFNGFTRIPYVIAGSMENPYDKKEAMLHVFNILGQRIRTISGGKRMAGRHVFTWNGKDGTGMEVPSGLYFYQMECENFSRTRKMILIR